MNHAKKTWTGVIIVKFSRGSTGLSIGNRYIFILPVFARVLRQRRHISVSPVIEFDHEVDQDVTSEPHTILLKKRNLKACSEISHMTSIVAWYISLQTGEALNLECSSFGYPQPFVRWEKNGRPLGVDILLTRDELVFADGDVEYDGHSITINNVQPSHSAVYSCHAENSFPLFVGGPSMPHQTILRIPIHIKWIQIYKSLYP